MSDTITSADRNKSNEESKIGNLFGISSLISFSTNNKTSDDSALRIRTKQESGSDNPVKRVYLNNSEQDWFTIWILERKETILRGGEVNWGDEVYIRSLINGKYLSSDLGMIPNR